VVVLGQCACYVTFDAVMWSCTDRLGTGLGIYGTSMSYSGLIWKSTEWVWRVRVICEFKWRVMEIY
jgi:hypothetical protein